MAMAATTAACPASVCSSSTPSAGTLAAWSPDVDLTHAFTVYDGSADGSVYTGLAIMGGGTNRLYAADFHNKRVDVFNGTFAKIAVPGGFTDATIPAGYAPFNIQAIGGPALRYLCRGRYDQWP
ncbi:MAG: TIGR03118 family protein [Asticcacaulis sp.]